MKKSVNVCQRYCQLLRQWARYSSQHRTKTGYTANVSHTRPLQHSSCTSTSLEWNQHQIGAYRRYCTSFEEIEDEPQEDAEEIPSVPLHTKTNIQARFRTENNDPRTHTLDDDGLFYQVSTDDYEKCIQQWQRPGYKKQVKTFTECTIMVRRPALDAFDIIDNVNLDYPPVKLVFYGKNGVGKTLSLAHVIHRYAKSDWLTIHLPSTMDWLRHKKGKLRPCSLSTFKEGLYDLTDDAIDWLVYFKKQNKHLLENLKTTKDYVWSSREKSEEGSSFMDIINFGIDRKKYASDCIGVLFREIKPLATDKKLKVLVAVDGINGFWKNTAIKNEDRQLVNAQDVSTFQHFIKLFEPDWSNGVIVGTVCQCVETLDVNGMEPESVPYTPRSLLKKQGFEFMDPFIPILVPEFSPKEAHNCIDYFIERKWIIKPRGLTEEGKKELLMLSNKNPLELVEISKYW